MKITHLVGFLFSAVLLSADTVQIIEIDRQGNAQVKASSTTVTNALPEGGEQIESSESRRNSSGQLTLDRAATTTTQTTDDGEIISARHEQRVDVNGRLLSDRQISERTVKISETDSRTERTIQARDPIRGGTAVAARESSTTRVEGDVTTTETSIQRPAGNAWREDRRISINEIKAEDGSVRREIVESGRSLYDRQSSRAGLGNMLEPQRKTVELEVPQADGSKAVTRQEFRRNVNGEWQPVGFSTEAGQKRIQ